MTIKNEDCPQCGNSGRVMQYTFTDIKPLSVAPLPNIIPSVHNNFSTKEAYCECEWGLQVKEVHRKMCSPGWINPFFVLSDDQIVELLKESTANQNAVEQEFE
jgi:hypothetical protein